MRATVMYAAGDVRVEDVPDAAIKEPTDAVVRVTHGSICGSDLWPYKSKPIGQPQRMGHEFIGVVEETGSAVSGLSRGDVVVAPFVWADNTCDFCRQGLQTSARHGGQWGHELDGGQGEAVRVPQAQGTLVKLPVGEDSALMPSLLTLSGTSVTVIGDGAVGLSAVPAAKRLGAERVRKLTGGDGTNAVLECVGTAETIATALDVVRDGGVVSRVGAAQYTEVPMDFGTLMRNLTLTGGVAPARAYIEELLPDILEGRIEPGRVFDRTIGLDEMPDGYRVMNDREALKVLVRP